MLLRDQSEHVTGHWQLFNFDMDKLVREVIEQNDHTCLWFLLSGTDQYVVTEQ